jgi:hypothetical protein
MAEVKTSEVDADLAAVNVGPYADKSESKNNF